MSRDQQEGPTADEVKSSLGQYEAAYERYRRAEAKINEQLKAELQLIDKGLLVCERCGTQCGAMCKPTIERIYACVSNQGTAMAETVLTVDEYANPIARAEAERIALSQLDCSRIDWHDVTGNEGV